MENKQPVETKYLKQVIDMLEKEAVDNEFRLERAEMRVLRLQEEKTKIREERMKLLLELAKIEGQYQVTEDPKPNHYTFNVPGAIPLNVAKIMKEAMAQIDACKMPRPESY